jgi:hypothetical protein
MYTEIPKRVDGIENVFMIFERTVMPSREAIAARRPVPTGIVILLASDRESGGLRSR